MSAARHIHPDQLSMFLPAHHLADPEKTAMVHIEYEGRTYENVKAQKLREGKTGGAKNARFRPGEWPGTGDSETLRESIQREGVKTPVQLYHGYEKGGDRPLLGEGHHRVFTAADLNPNLEIPVTHHSRMGR